MQYLLPVFIFGLGTIIGSFLNVVVCRFGTGRSPLWGKSCCFSCGMKLRPYELIPLVSYLIQKGRCRSCRSAVAPQYAAVEFLTGLLFVITAYTLGVFTGYFFPAELFFWLTAWSLFVIVSVYDVRHAIIPDPFVATLGVLGFISVIVRGGYFPDFMMGIAAFLFFFALWVFSRGRAIGLGDAKLALAIGWLFPWRHAFSALLVSVWLGAIFGIILIGMSKKNYGMKSELPFGPFLALGAFLTFAFDIVLL